MNHFPDTVSMAMFCDFENVALGVRDANYEKFDIKLVLERLLLKAASCPRRPLLRLGSLQGLQGGDARGQLQS